MSRTGVLHFRRWRLLWTPWFGVYIHRIYKADDDKFLHDHPWDYFSMILKGSYTEMYCNVIVNYTRRLDPGNWGFNKATRFHKIYELNSESVTTLFITCRRKRDWGYHIGQCWVQHEAYRKNKDNIAEYCSKFIHDKNENTDVSDSIRLLQ